ncbi:MAG: phosphate acyltransferase PlsX [Pseudomonadota bacterium]
MSADTVISVDAMGGDKGPAVIFAGMNRALRDDPHLSFILHGPEAQLTRLLARRRKLAGRVEVRHAPDSIAMDERPSRAVRGGRKSSLWKALESVANGDASAAFSAGNTGAIVALSMLVLRKAPGVDRPAIAVHWPARNARGYNVALDMGADIRADGKVLCQYAIMGAEYARLAFGHENPRVGLLNIGAEDTKGRQERHDARRLLSELDRQGDAAMDFCGFVEGNDFPGDNVDVIVTDGFTGNIALKAAEGTAAFIRGALHDAFRHSFLSRIGGLFALGPLNRMRRRIDPRRVNGGVFLGLNGGVVKSHGSADAVGHASAIALAAKIARQDLSGKVSRQLANLDLDSIFDALGEANGIDGK